MNYESWRATFQSSEQAARAAFEDLQAARAESLEDIRAACRDRGLRRKDELVRHIRELTNKAELWDEYQGKVAELRGFDIKTGKPEAPAHD